jgi:hypothetical protein
MPYKAEHVSANTLFFSFDVNSIAQALLPLDLGFVQVSMFSLHYLKLFGSQGMYLKV